MLNVQKIREDFPILHQEIKGHPLIYLDNAASTQKPKQVIDAICQYYQQDNANVHRGVHTLSQRATDLYEGSRQKVADFVGAKSIREIIFTRGTTEAINLVAQSWGEANTGAKDNIILSQLEHHSNLIPWQVLSKKTGVELRYIPLLEDGTFDMNAFAGLLDEHTKLVSVNHMSNALGTIHDIESIIQQAHSAGALVLIDGAQSVPHIPVDVQSLDVDFLAFSGHKMAGPTGIGVLYAKEALLEAMPPYQSGGDMIEEVWLDKATYNKLPYKFEAGTPFIAGAVGLGAAIDYLNRIGLEHVLEHEHLLTQYALKKMSQFEGITLYGPEASQRGGIVSFNIEGIHPQDIGTMLDEQGIAIRTGHHCCQPLMRHYDILGTARASFYLYNNLEEVEHFVAALEKVVGIFQRAKKRREARKNAR